MKRESIRRLVLAAMLLAMGMVLPFFTGQIKEIGDSLLPMHMPVMLCGILCGWGYGLAVGILLPFLRSVSFGMPPLYPNAIWMALELAAYGFVIGILYRRRKEYSRGYLFFCLGASMIAGRIVWGISKAILLGVAGKPFGMAAFLTGGFLDAIPGIALQLILLPTIIEILERKNHIRKEEETMKTVLFPYGKEKIEHHFEDEELLAVLESSINDYKPPYSAEELIRSAMENPIGSPKLSELARGKKNIVIIASDHTRPVPSKLIIPPMLKEIRAASPSADVTILIATGCHRGTTRAELVDKFGEDIVANERIHIHDCDDRDLLVNIGTLPSGGECEINRLAYDADLLLSEGFIEPHFFAGFSGGRKSVLPGVCGRSTVLANHCSEFIAHENARTGVLESNPIHEDMLWAAKKAGLAYIVNVVLNDKKEVIFATAGSSEAAHAAGTDFLSSLCVVNAQPADVVITTNGGYPLDQNVYQAVKGMTAGEATVKKGGVIIMLARSNDGIGGAHFYKQLAEEPDIQKTMSTFLQRKRSETVPDQWQTQILLRILMHAHVIYVSSVDDETVMKMHMTPAHSIAEALEKARQLLRKERLQIVAIPDGVSVIVR